MEVDNPVTGTSTFTATATVPPCPVAATPVTATSALAFATMTVKDNLEKGESLPAAVADKMVGLEL